VPARARALSSLSLARCPVGPTCRRRPHPRSCIFSRCPMGPACHPDRPFTCPPSLTGGSHLSGSSPPNRPCTTRASPWTPRLRRTPWPRPSPPWPFSSCPAPAHPPLPSLAHRQPSALASHRAHAQGVPLPFTVSLCPFRGRRRALVVLVAPVSSASSLATQDTP
jgi:hypothetical protein